MRKVRDSRRISNSWCNCTPSKTRCSPMKQPHSTQKNRAIRNSRIPCFILRKSKKDQNGFQSIISRSRARLTKRLKKNAVAKARPKRVNTQKIWSKSHPWFILLKVQSSLAVSMQATIISNILECLWLLKSRTSWKKPISNCQKPAKIRLKKTKMKSVHI